MNNLILSIIIPVYNVEQYIAECLDSVYMQDIDESMYEVICVNDASTDKSQSIVEAYGQKHKNLVLINHPRNLKLGTARNTGIAVAKGKYVWHVDADDYIYPNCLKELTRTCLELDLDVLEFGYVGAHNKPIGDNEPRRSSNVISGQEYIRKYFLSNFGAICPIWRRVYKRDFLLSNGIVSPPINMGEDQSYAIQAFCLAQKVSYVNKNWYYHRINAHSLVGDNKHNWPAFKWYEASFNCAENLNKVFLKIKESVPVDIRMAIANMIKYDIVLIHYYKNHMTNDKYLAYWRICRKNVWRNRFVFKYLNCHFSMLYIRKIVSVGWKH